MKPNNPFLISGYYSPEYFCNRERETQTITDALYNGRNLTLIAPRRMGKTGLIKHVFHRLKEQQADIVTLYMDIYSTQNLGDFVRLLANTVLGQLDSAPQKALSRVSQFIKSCRPVFTFDELTGVPKVTIEIAPAAEETTLKEIFDYLKSSDKRCYIAIDEFQQIAEYPEDGTEALLRSYIQFLPNVYFIFAGSKQHMMTDMFLSAKRPFYQSSQILNLPLINQDEYHRFANRWMGTRNLTMDPDTFAYLYNKVDGQTWYIQDILNRLYQNGKEITTAEIDDVTLELVNEQEVAFVNYYDSLTDNQAALLSAIAQDKAVTSILSQDFISRHNLPAASSVSLALKTLINREFIYKYNGSYIIYDRFFGMWLRKNCATSL